MTDKWRAFNWNVLEADGHNWDEIYGALERGKRLHNGKPTMIIMHTTKAKDCSGVENTPGSHNIKAPDKEAHKGFLDSLKSGKFQLPY